ncbi:L-glutamate gamma-semialdehyde dehydrogenase [Desulfotomaculum copahuensis]|uniref:L-glutamate gamma-semialdehyde dehydrogenase n=1 Tax=Desulfotomaculum copahuensis TaxID=1838280 RepID=A0A1B7LAK1_9FIRM|nr:L-glutamate gamma-semialdehyde dehydrogenase [Desulfotomaculum copahuensis]OAT79359.1 L-glutamate gamma-semialdehyde dehydrogenase [Desulfotomaculum copahuensis]
MFIPFVNEPLTDFTREENRRRMNAALAAVRERTGRTYPLLIGGEEIHTGEKIVSYNPSQHDEVIGQVSRADRALAEKALQTAAQTFTSWRLVPPEARARYLFKAAAIMRRRKFELSAWMVLEAGKPWAEADADTAEAIDFLEFYGREMIRLGAPQPVTAYPGEENTLEYIPLGVGVVIPPWNFPLAILTGTAVGPVVAGNTVILKPSSNTPVIAAMFMEVMREAGLPDGVINYLPGNSADIGDFLTGHPLVHFINFTGSKDTGLHINRLAAQTAPGQRWIKRVAAEMGGKDAIIIDADCDLDEAVAGAVTSAYGFSGQKCSACSRLIVTGEAYAPVLTKLVERVKQLKVGPAEEWGTSVGPVIDAASYKKITGYIETGRREGEVLTGGTGDDSRGYFVQPTVIAGVSPAARIAQEEIFGPVLAVIQAKDFDEAIAIANNTDYGLTGGVYSRNRNHLEQARREFHVGNLYLNRKCTGALVGVQPFGGFNLSGTNSKAGGRDYLKLFMQAKSIAERF